jgi:hypothetical protein
LGAIASHVCAAELAGPGQLPKPVIAPFVIDTELQGVPLAGSVSGVPNLSYVTFPSDVRADLREFRQTVAFQKVALLVNRYM